MFKEGVRQAKNEIEKEEIDCRGEIAWDFPSLHLAFLLSSVHGHVLFD